MGAAQDRARPKVQLVSAFSQLAQPCPQVKKALLESMDHVDSKSALFTRGIARLFFHYGEARLNWPGKYAWI